MIWQTIALSPHGLVSAVVLCHVKHSFIVYPKRRECILEECPDEADHKISVALDPDYR